MEEVNYWTFYKDVSFSGFTLIVPSVAVGNVGQLTCDLLISSLDMKKIASLYSPAFIPVLGHNPYDLKSSSLSGSCELYQSTEKSLLVLQIRSPLVFKYAKNFLQAIVKKFKERNVKDVIILSSSYAHEKKYIQTSPFRYAATELCPYIKTITDLKWLEHESAQSQELHIFGGGFASILYEICREQSLPCLILYKYCSEGDNIPDAYEMIEQLTFVLDLFEDDEDTDLFSQIVQPVSWKLLFGSPPPVDIY